MRKNILMFLLAASCAWSQAAAWKPAPPPPVPPLDTTQTKPAWTHKLVGSLLGNQVTFTDWKQGGENSIAWNVLLDGKSVYDLGRNNWSNSLKFGFGNTKLGDKSTRKTDDRIELESVYTRKLNLYVNPYAAATFKTQFAPGYSYDAKEARTRVSQFLNPAYITQSLGLGYQPIAQLKFRLGAGLREIVADEFAAIYTDDKKTTDKVEKYVIDGGTEMAVNLDWKVSKNLLLTSVLESFAAFKNFKNPMMRSNTSLSASVSKYVTVRFDVQTINEPLVTPRTQVKQALSVGLSYTFF